MSTGRSSSGFLPSDLMVGESTVWDRAYGRPHSRAMCRAERAKNLTKKQQRVLLHAATLKNLRARAPISTASRNISNLERYLRPLSGRPLKARFTLLEDPGEPHAPRRHPHGNHRREVQAPRDRRTWRDGG